MDQNDVMSGVLERLRIHGPAKNVPTSFSKQSFFQATDMVLPALWLPLRGSLGKD